MNHPHDEDPRPEWMCEAGITKAEIRREAESDAPDAWVFRRIHISVWSEDPTTTGSA